MQTAWRFIEKLALAIVLSQLFATIALAGDNLKGGGYRPCRGRFRRPILPRVLEPTVNGSGRF